MIVHLFIRPLQSRYEWSNFCVITKRTIFESNSFQTFQGPTPIRLCFLIEYLNSTNEESQCIPGNISFMDLDLERRKQFISQFIPKISAFIGDRGSLVQGGRNLRNRTIENEFGDIEIQDIRCGRFGLPLTFRKNTVPVFCEGECESVMCLSLNVTTGNQSADLTIEKCNSYVLIMETKPFLRQLPCPTGYYRSEIKYAKLSQPDACLSIQMFPQPIPVKDLDDNIVKSYCKESIMSLNTEDDMFMFMQLSEQTDLAERNNCLFGLSSNKIVSYSDWSNNDYWAIDPYNLNWDKTMNYEGIIAKDALSYLAVKPNGEWTWSVDTVSCIVCAIEIGVFQPELLLNYDFSERKLLLSVTHQDFLYRERNSDLGFICHAIIHDIYRSNLTAFPNSMGKYFIANVGVGEYWCSGHAMRGWYSYYHTSNKLDAYGMVFVFEIESNGVANSSSIATDLLRFVERNYNFVKVIDSDIMDTFIVHLSLKFRDGTGISLDTTFVDLTNYQTETVFIYEQMNKIIREDVANEMNIKSINSAEYCLHESTLSMDAIIWQIADINETISTSPLCISDDAMSVETRTCLGDPILGTYWKELVPASKCRSDVSHSLLELYLNLNQCEPSRTVRKLSNILQNNVDILLPLDVFLTSRILQKLSNVTLCDLSNIFTIFNSLQQIEVKVLKISASLNSTNILLEALDRILLRHVDSFILGSNQFTNLGNVSIQSPLLVTFVLDPIVSGVSGVALCRHRPKFSSDGDSFTNYSARYIYPNETVHDVMTNHLGNNDLVLGSYLPADLLRSSDNVTIVMTFFFNDKLFQSPSSAPVGSEYFEANGKIVSVTVLGLIDNSELPSKIPLFFETDRIDDLTCRYWSFTLTNGWSSDGCYLTKIFSNDFQQLALCECSHLTHFGCLISSNMPESGKLHNRSLITITLIGCSFSLFGTIGIFITGLVFANWRKKLSSKMLIHFSASIALEMSLMILTNLPAIENNTNSLTCIVMGSMLHYSVLTIHTWTLIIAYFQFKRYVTVFNFTIRHLLLKSTVFGWGAPLLPVIAVLIIDRTLYLPIDELNFCYPTGWALHFVVIAPIVLISLVNFTVYLSVLVSLHQSLKKSSCMTDSSKFRQRLSQTRLFAFLFFTLGLTWLFGFISKIQPSSYLVFTYLFCITATIQGLVLFLYFVIFDQNVRRMWLNYFRNIICGD